MAYTALILQHLVTVASTSGYDFTKVLLLELFTFPSLLFRSFEVMMTTDKAPLTNVLMNNKGLDGPLTLSTSQRV